MAATPITTTTTTTSTRPAIRIRMTTEGGTADRDPDTASTPELGLLLTWFSPSCPIGAFSYSHGLETLFEAGGLDDAAAAKTAIETALRDGAGRTDAILAAHAWRAAHAGAAAALNELGDLGLALSPSRERREETLRQGNAFAELFDAVWPGAMALSDRDRPLPVVLGAAGAMHGLPLRPLLVAALHAFAANLVSAAVRLVPLGQTDGQRITAAMLPVATLTAREAEAAQLNDIHSAAIGLDIAAMGHETQHVRLFRS